MSWAARPSGLAALVLTLALGACSTGWVFESRSDHADRLAAARGWSRFHVTDSDFPLSGYRAPNSDQAPDLTIYFEGDGYAWVDLRTPSTDPTPRDPIGLRLALSDPLATHYLARPCQFAGRRAPRCETRYWTGARFAPEVVAAAGAAIDRIKAGRPTARLHLAGFSGGGVLAALVAASRQDVASLVTVAAPMDVDLWTVHHGVAALRGSQSPIDFIESLRCLPQIHIVGERDRVVPGTIVQSYLDRLQASPNRRCDAPDRAPPKPILLTAPGLGHDDGWQAVWASLLASARQR
jgi:hypothetical protein